MLGVDSGVPRIGVERADLWRAGNQNKISFGKIEFKFQSKWKENIYAGELKSSRFKDFTLHMMVGEQCDKTECSNRCVKTGAMSAH